MAKNLKDIYIGVKKDDLFRNKNDLYRTPPIAAYVLEKYTDIPQNVVEPCAGYGNLSVELQRTGHNVISYDLNEYPDSLIEIHTGKDALTLEKQGGYDAVITNPPYHKDLPRKLIEKFTSEYDYVAFFVRLTFLEGTKRKKFFEQNPPSDIIFISDRIRFDSSKKEPVEIEDQIGGMIAYMWIVFNKKAQHKNTNLKWVLLSEEYDEWRKHYENSSTFFEE